MNKLSVCVIVGNEAIHIDRFVRSFSKIADEFVFVRAIGSAKSDFTIGKAIRLCDELNIRCVTGEYLNALDEREDWSHVDDFGAARQKSFDLAMNAWLMWADCDDIWPETENNEAFIEELKAGKLDEYSLINIDYQVPDANAMVARERFAKLSAHPKWYNPIHEDMRVEGKRLYVDTASIVHAPLGDKIESAIRNLRILEFASNRPDLYPDQSTLWFYKHRELMYLGKFDEAMEAANKALTLLSPLSVEGKEIDTHIVLLYEILLITAGIALEKGDASDARARAHGAVNVMPGRREAYAVLAHIEHSQRNYHKMLAYAAAMRGIEEPRGIHRTWTQRDALYSWHGAFLYHQSLRLCGQIAKAEIEEENVFQMEGASITIIHPTMLRADLALQTYGKWMSTAVNPGSVQYIFAIDPADDYSRNVLNAYKTVLCPRGSRAAADFARKFATGKKVKIIGDYWDPTKGWDQDFSKVVPPALEWKLNAPIEGYPNIITKTSPRYIICGKEGKSDNPDFQPQHCHFELGWEQGTTHVYTKWLLSTGKLNREDIIVTLSGRQFLYKTCFNRVLTWEEYCKEVGLKFGLPYPDASRGNVLDLVRYFERNWHRYDSIYFSGPNSTWSGKAWNEIQSFKATDIYPGSNFLLMSLRKRPHESRRNTSDEFGTTLLQKLKDAFKLPIFLVGLNLPDYGVSGVHGCSLADFATMAQDTQCKAILGPHSGPNGLAGLLAPHGKDIIIFPQEFCPSINSNYPTGMGKCLNLNGNIRHWLSVGASPDDIVTKTKEVLSK